MHLTIRHRRILLAFCVMAITSVHGLLPFQLPICGLAYSAEPGATKIAWHGYESAIELKISTYE